MNNPESGVDVLKNAGVDKTFIDSMFGKYGKFAGKLGMDTNSLKGMVDRLGNAVNSSNRTQTPTSTKKTKTSFNSSKYPKV